MATVANQQAGQHVRTLANYVGGQWAPVAGAPHLDVTNPATGAVLSRVPLSTAAEVDRAVRAAHAAFAAWRAIPPINRARYMFKLRDLMEESFEDLARTVEKNAPDEHSTAPLCLSRQVRRVAERATIVAPGRSMAGVRL